MSKLSGANKLLRRLLPGSECEEEAKETYPRAAHCKQNPFANKFEDSTEKTKAPAGNDDCLLKSGSECVQRPLSPPSAMALIHRKPVPSLARRETRKIQDEIEKPRPQLLAAGNVREAQLPRAQAASVAQSTLPGLENSEGAYNSSKSVPTPDLTPTTADSLPWLHIPYGTFENRAPGDQGPRQKAPLQRSPAISDLKGLPWLQIAYGTFENRGNQPTEFSKLVDGEDTARSTQQTQKQKQTQSTLPLDASGMPSLQVSVEPSMPIESTQCDNNLSTIPARKIQPATPRLQPTPSSAKKKYSRYVPYRPQTDHKPAERPPNISSPITQSTANFRIELFLPPTPITSISRPAPCPENRSFEAFAPKSRPQPPLTTLPPAHEAISNADPNPAPIATPTSILDAKATPAPIRVSIKLGSPNPSIPPLHLSFLLTANRPSSENITLAIHIPLILPARNGHSARHTHLHRTITLIPRTAAQTSQQESHETNPSAELDGRDTQALEVQVEELGTAMGRKGRFRRGRTELITTTTSTAVAALKAWKGTGMGEASLRSEADGEVKQESVDRAWQDWLGRRLVSRE